MSDQFSDVELVRMIQAEGEERMQALKMLYLDQRVRGGIRKIMKEERSMFEYDDLLQETFIIFDRNIRNRRFLVPYGVGQEIDQLHSTLSASCLKQEEIEQKFENQLVLFAKEVFTLRGQNATELLQVGKS